MARPFLLHPLLAPPTEHFPSTLSCRDHPGGYLDFASASLLALMGCGRGIARPQTRQMAQFPSARETRQPHSPRLEIIRYCPSNSTSTDTPQGCSSALGPYNAGTGTFSARKYMV